MDGVGSPRAADVVVTCQLIMVSVSIEQELCKYGFLLYIYQYAFNFNDIRHIICLVQVFINKVIVVGHSRMERMQMAL